MSEKIIHVDLPDGAKMRAFIILYSAEGNENCIKVASMEDGGPNAEDTGVILQSLIEHLNIVLRVGKHPRADA